MSLLNTYQSQTNSTSESLTSLSLQVKRFFQESIKSYSDLFNDQESFDELIDKVKGTERRMSGLLKQVKTLNQDLNELFAFFKRQEGNTAGNVVLQNESICSFNGMPFVRQ